MAKNMLILNVCYNGENVNLSLAPECTVGELKTKIIEKIGNICDKKLYIILGGNLLDNDEGSLQECSIEHQTTLHAFTQKKPADNKHVHHSMICQYYVYCKDCNSLSTGKLRITCSKCEKGVFLADRDPDGWHDITESQKISGKCQFDSCDGNTAKFYFKCSANHNTAVGLRHIRPNSNNVSCIACEEVRSPVLVYPCEAKHVTCLDCFKIYCIVRLNERRFIHSEKYGYTLPCPAKCTNSLIQEVHHFYLMGEDQYKRYKGFSIEEFVLNDGGFLCPARGCGDAVYPDVCQGENRSMQCPSQACQFKFCIDCRCAAHDGDCNLQMINPAVTEDSHINSEQAERARWETQSRQTITKTTKKCPKCKTCTEKDGGCSHMHCTRCDFSWCWICEQEWNLECQGDHWFD